MEEVIVCEPVRTPVGRFAGALSTVPDGGPGECPPPRAAQPHRAGDVDDVVLGQCYPNGEAPALGRIAALDAGLGPEGSGSAD